MWVPLSALPSSVWKRNLDALAESDPSLAERLRSEREASGTQVQVGENRQITARIRDTEFTIGADPASHRAPAEIAAAWRSGARLVCLCRLGDGIGLPKIPSLQGPVGLLVVEPDVELVLLSFSLWDMTSLLRSGQVLWAVGEDWERCVRHMFQRQGLFALNEHQIRYVPGGTVKTNFSPIREHIVHIANAERAEFRARHRAVMAASSPTIESPGTVLTVVGIHSAWTTILEGLSEGFGELGWKTPVVRVPRGAFTKPYRLLAEYLSETPEILLLINHFSSSDAPLLAPYHRTLRFVYFVDDPDDMPASRPHPCDRAFTLCRGFSESMERRGIQAAAEIPMGISSKIHSAQPKDEYRCEVSYVGYIGDQRKLLSQFPAVWRDYVERLAEIKSSKPEHQLKRLLEEIPVPNEGEDRVNRILATAGWKIRYLPPDQRLRYLIYVLANTKKRLNVIEQLGRFDVAVFGPEDWKELLPEKLSPVYRGPIESREDLASLYASSHVTLSIQSLQDAVFYNMRNFEVPMMGGFLISEWVEDSDRFLEPDEEMCYYETTDELVQKIEEYKNAPERRQEIIIRAQERILREHTFRHRAQAMLDSL